jgi:MFS family permease
MSQFLRSLPQGFLPFFIGRMITLVASGLIGVFAPIFLYQYFGGSITYVGLWFMVGWVAYIILSPIMMKLVEFIGLRYALIASTFFGAAYYFVLANAEQNDVFATAIMSAVLIIFWRFFYWLPYHLEFVTLTEKGHRGQQSSFFWASASVIGMITPLIGGVIIYLWSFSAVFYVAMVLFLLQAIPYLLIPKANEQYTWGYWETWRNFFSRRYRQVVVSHFALGAENTVGLLIWPIFIFLLLEGNIFEVGVISSIIVMVSVFGEILLGKYIDAHAEERVLSFAGIMNALGWIAKMFVTTAFHIFVAGAYHSVVHIFVRTPLTARVSDFIADQGHYIDEVTVIREIAIGLGKCFAFGLVIFVLMFASIQWTFILAAGASLFFNAIYNKRTL